MERLTTVLAVIVGVIICAILIFLALKIFGGSKEEGDKLSSPIIKTEETETSESAETAVPVTMPDVKGMNEEDAVRTLSELGLKAEKKYEESDNYDAGVVISADVSVGASLEKGSKVTLTISSGTEGVEVPSVSGKTFDEANTQLIGLGFLVNKAEGYSDTIEKGIVISQNPSSWKQGSQGKRDYGYGQPWEGRNQGACAQSGRADRGRRYL